MKSIFSIFISLMIIGQLQAQKKDLPYKVIPDYPAEYTPGNVTARLVDGLGFRYYWATEGLTEENLQYKSNDEGRTIDQTIDHIWGLTRIAMNSTKKVATTFDVNSTEMTFQEKRRQTLGFIKLASDNLRKCSQKDFEEMDMIFKSPNGTQTYPFWNQLNGPIADALWHVGQVVSMRRGAGNPFNSKVNVLEGNVRN